VVAASIAESGIAQKANELRKNRDSFILKIMQEQFN
jgi:hypothetical protein